MRQVSIAFLATFFLLAACRHEPFPLPEPDEFDRNVSPYLTIGRTPADYSPNLPAYQSGFFPAASPDAAKAQLGRVLFFDKKLSKDGTVSCGTCHLPERAFAQNEKLSTGVFGQHTPRNAMAIGNTAWFGGYVGLDTVGAATFALFWDSRAHSVAEQSNGAFTNPVEMGMTMPEVLQIIDNQSFYGWLFKQAYGDSVATEARIFTALSHFMSSIGSNQSKFDLAFFKQIESGAGEDLTLDFAQFSAAENLGKSLYLKNCNSCHASLTTPQLILEANNGLENPYTDKGKGAISNLFYENGVFKVPGLRNVAVTGPYMHDGRFASLEEVIEHYNSGVVKVFGLHGDLLEQTAPGTYSPKRLNLTDDQKAALKSFLETLTDAQFLADPKFSNPFK